MASSTSRPAGTALERAESAVREFVCEIGAVELLVEPADSDVTFSPSDFPPSASCSSIRAIARRGDAFWRPGEPDGWIFLNAGSGSGWVDIDGECDRRYGRRPPDEDPVRLCRWFLDTRDGAGDDPGLERDVLALPVQETASERRARYVEMTLQEQFAEALCASFGVQLANLPPLTDTAAEVSKVVTIGGDRADVAEDLGEAFCGEVEVIGRLPEVPTLRDDDDADATMVPFPVYVRLGPPANREGWISPDNCWFPEILLICGDSNFHFRSELALVGDHGARILGELRAVPIMPVDPRARDGLPELALTVDPPSAGGECRGVDVRIENVGTAATPSRVEVAYGATTHVLDFFRGIEPGEWFELKTTDYDVSVVVDPKDRIREADEDNNAGNTGADPGLTCIQVER